MDCIAQNLQDERLEEERFLLSVREGIANDIQLVKRGGIPMNWRGYNPDEILARLRRHQDNVTRAIQHVRDEGSLTDIVSIVWGTK